LTFERNPELRIQNPEPQNLNRINKLMAPLTPYTPDLAGRDPLEAIGDTIARIEAMTAHWTPAEFERTYAPQKWSARQILTHLAHSELAFGTRARMALTTRDYAAQSFDQDLWMAREADLNGRAAANAYLSMSRMNMALFEGLSEADLLTPFSHPEYGSLTVNWILHQTAGHQIHHLKQLDEINHKRG
jgi:DinB family protein